MDGRDKSRSYGCPCHGGCVLLESHKNIQPRLRREWVCALSAWEMLQ